MLQWHRDSNSFVDITVIHVDGEAVVGQKPEGKTFCLETFRLEEPT